MTDFAFFRETVEFMVAATAVHVFTVYILTKREFHFHSLIVTLLALTYIIAGIPQWLIAHEFIVKMALVVLCGGLIGRALRELPRIYAVVVGGIGLVAVIGWTLVRAFWV